MLTKIRSMLYNAIDALTNSKREADRNRLKAQDMYCLHNTHHPKQHSLTYPNSQMSKPALKRSVLFSANSESPQGWIRYTGVYKLQ